MGKTLSVLGFVLTVWYCRVASCETWYVDASVPASGDGRTWETAFKTIREGIPAASDRDTVIVAPGTYVENIYFAGKNVVLTSADPLDPTVVANTIIDGRQSGSVVSFSGTEDDTCVLSGFTIRDGDAAAAMRAGGINGGTWPQRNHAIIRNNVIRDNLGFSGGGVAYCDGLIENNLVFGNIAEGSGGGLDFCNGIIRNNTVVGNRVTGFISPDQTWTAGEGGGLYACDGTIVNCIVWDNSRGPQVDHSSLPSYSCIEDWPGGGEGNISFCPYFVDAASEDFHLQSWSPCIDAGDPGSPFANEPAPSGGRVNMGADGNTPQAACKSPDDDGDGLPDDWESHWFGHLGEDGAGDADDDRVQNLIEYRYASDPTLPAPAIANNISKDAWYFTIQQALTESHRGDEIVVLPGTHEENLSFGGKDIVLRSTCPGDPDVVANTIIDGRGKGPVVSFSGTETASCVVSGFTIQNGWDGHGAGIDGGTHLISTHATIENNRIWSNTAEGSGGGLYCCDGLIRNNTILDNQALTTAGPAGAGLYDCDGIIENNRISGNWGSFDSVPWKNSLGGGLWGCDGVIRNNVISGNSAKRGGGLHGCLGKITNNVIYANTAFEAGGGLRDCEGEIVNCIIWANTADVEVHQGQLSYSSSPSYSCIQDWTGGGMGSTNSDPRFVNAAMGDYRLLPESPCIDAGLNDAWMRDATDLDGKPRVLLGNFSMTVDMGAYEFGSFAFKVVGFTRENDGKAGLSWSSRPGDTYTIWSCSDLAADIWTEEATVPSEGQTTTWTDTNVTPSRQKFYRIQIYQ